MSLKTFLKLVEIQTKIASVFPFLIGCLFVLYSYGTFSIMHTSIFFASMLLFDLTTTAINNYMDYRKALSNEYRQEKNIIGQQNISESIVIATIVTMLVIASGLGIWLVVLTDLLVLMIGMACFTIGIFYTFGPIPLSRMPLGEAFSGITMGFGILFLTIYVNAFDTGIASLIWEGQTVMVQADILHLFQIALISLPSMFTIANLMLANNLCDLQDDINNHRFTLPFYIGKKYATWLFNGLYAASFLSIIVAGALQVLPWFLIFSLLAAYPVYQNVRQFNKKQSKSCSFPLAVKNLVLINGTFVLLLTISLFI